ncbi:MAG: YjbQ family protein [Chloroflexota bacterium]|nr:YjbQ family protein [Chloroflexota bacterium]
MIFVAAGKLLLDTWGSILLLELDGPRQRQLSCTTLESPRA